MIYPIEIADLFCGAGGTSTGAIQAAQALGFSPRLTAVNHWTRAVETHSANHPEARHVCASVDSINPRHLYPDGKLDILWASPECTHHSRARGGKPMSDQSRASGHCVTRWAEALRPDVILVENVREFAEWGPLGADGKPLKRQKGATFRAWIGMLESLGYRVDHRILCAADFGDPTSRERLFVQAVRGRRRIVWPTPTHRKGTEPELFGGSRPWRAAREIIDWSLPSQSITDRKRPLAPNTMRRILEGLKKFGLNPSLVCMEHGGRVVSVDRPMPTITTARAGAIGVAEPFLVAMRGTDDRQISGSARAISDPLSTISAGGVHHALVEPFLLSQQSGGAPRSVSEPVPTIATGGAVGLCEPFFVEYYGTGGARPISEPLGTVTTKPRFGLAMPEVVHQGQRYLLDVRFRMLQPHELAAAQGFPAGYRFAGNKTEVVRQIGNAVPCGLARALVTAVLSHRQFSRVHRDE